MIYVFSGTSDGKKIIDKLVNKNKISCFNATVYGSDLYEYHNNLKVYTESLDYSEIESLVKSEKPEMIIDCTHPYAENISKTLIDISNNENILYLRYERPNDELDIKLYDSYDEIVNALNKLSGNILLTTGSNNLDKFTKLIDNKRIFARVLPTEGVIEKCYKLGLKCKNIIAIQGPFSRSMNIAMYEDYNIKYIVTKSSGKAGGYKEKVETALELGIEVLVLKRPDIKYPNKYSNIDELVSEVNRRKK